MTWSFDPDKIPELVEALHPDDVVLFAGPSDLADVDLGRKPGQGGILPLGMVQSFSTGGNEIRISRAMINTRAFDAVVRAGIVEHELPNGTRANTGAFGLVVIFRDKSLQTRAGYYYGGCWMPLAPMITVSAGEAMIMEGWNIPFQTVTPVRNEAPFTKLFEPPPPRIDPKWLEQPLLPLAKSVRRSTIAERVRQRRAKRLFA